MNPSPPDAASGPPATERVRLINRSLPPLVWATQLLDILDLTQTSDLAVDAVFESTGSLCNWSARTLHPAISLFGVIADHQPGRRDQLWCSPACLAHNPL